MVAPTHRYISNHILEGQTKNKFFVFRETERMRISTGAEKVKRKMKEKTALKEKAGFSC